jgi:histidyl-tRNA synthetase
MAGAPMITDNLCDACKENFEAVQAGLRAEGVVFEIDPRLVRGLDYYTRTAFEFVSDVLGGQQGTVCGGGRYDGLAEELGGPATPGIGFGLGLERTLLAMEGEGVPLPRPNVPAVFVVAIGDAARAEGAALVRSLREAGMAADTAYEDRPLKAQLRMADRAGARYAAIIGEREVDAKTVTMRRLADGDQQSIPIEEAGEWISRQA